MTLSDSGTSSRSQEVASAACSRPARGTREGRRGPGTASPAPTELGVEIALGHPGGIVVVQEVAAVASLAEPSQPMLAHSGLGPAVPGVALHTWDSPVTASLSP